MPLNTQANFHDAGRTYFRSFSANDDFYELLIDTHLGLDDEQSEQVNARLILLLANHIGDLAVLREAMALARAGVQSSNSDVCQALAEPGLAPPKEQ